MKKNPSFACDDYDRTKAKIPLQHYDSYVFDSSTDKSDDQYIAPTTNVTPLSSRACSSEVYSFRLNDRPSFGEKLQQALVFKEEEEEEEVREPEAVGKVIKSQIITGAVEPQRTMIISTSDTPEGTTSRYVSSKTFVGVNASSHIDESQLPELGDNFPSPQTERFGIPTCVTVANEIALGSHPVQANDETSLAQDILIRNRNSFSLSSLSLTLLFPSMSKQVFSQTHQTYYTGILARAFCVSKNTVSLRTVSCDPLQVEALIWGWKDEADLRNAVRDLENGTLLSYLNEQLGRVDLVQWSYADSSRNQLSLEPPTDTALSTAMNRMSTKDESMFHAMRTSSKKSEEEDGSAASEKYRRIEECTWNGLDSHLVGNGIRSSEKIYDNKIIRGTLPSRVRMKEFQMSGGRESANDDIETVSTATLPLENIQKVSYSFTEFSHHPGNYVRKKMSFRSANSKWDCCELRDKHAPFCRRGPPKHHSRKYAEFMWPCCRELSRSAPGCVDGHNADSLKLLNHLHNQYALELHSGTGEDDVPQVRGGSWKGGNQEEAVLQDTGLEERCHIIATDHSQLYAYARQREAPHCAPCTSASTLGTPAASVSLATLPEMLDDRVGGNSNVRKQEEDEGCDAALNTQVNFDENDSKKTATLSHSISRPVARHRAENLTSDSVEQVENISRWPDITLRSGYYLGKV